MDGERNPTDQWAIETLARFVSRLSLQDLSTKDVDKAKLHIRDGLANQLAASTMDIPALRVAAEFSEWGGAQQATVILNGEKLPAPLAAMVNSMLGHGIELDDAHGPALTKCGSVLIPAAIASTEHAEGTGGDLIAAVVAGYEVMIRVGLMVNPSHRRRGFHTTGTAGTFGAAAAAARAYRLNDVETADALSLAAMQAAGIQSYLDWPSMAKPLSPGKAAMNGLLAARLAGRGFTGPHSVIGGREDFCKAYADEADITQLLANLEGSFKINEVGFKPHAACRYAHGPIDIAQTLHRERTEVLEEISQVQVDVSELALRQSGHSGRPSLNSAMGSTAFGVAVGLLRGDNGLASYRAAFDDNEIHEFADRVVVRADARYGTMGRGATITLVLRDGREIVEECEEPRGEPSNPLTKDEIDTKYQNLAGMRLSDTHVKELDDAIGAIESQSSIDRWVSKIGMMLVGTLPE